MQKTLMPQGDARAFCTSSASLFLGIDVGSTTTKAVLIDGESKKLLFSRYHRHQAYQVKSVAEVIDEAMAACGDVSVRVAVCGSGGESVASLLGVPYVQEVVANAIAVRTEHPEARCAIELGGQDAKIIFFHRGEHTGSLEVSDMRMNGSCAGGTGAFIDEIATLLTIPVEEFDDFAARGEARYSISGRCGVFAKTDIQPLLNQGASREDLARSTFQAIAKQTIGGLAQGLEIEPPVVFEGGPLTFNRTLVDVFAQRLSLSEDQVIRPDHPELIMARGAAYALDGLLEEAGAPMSLSRMAEKIAACDASGVADCCAESLRYFADEAEYRAFEQRHLKESLQANVLCDAVDPGLSFDPEKLEQPEIECYLGIDSGSTTTKFVLIDDSDRAVVAYYASNEGEPLEVARRAFSRLEQVIKEHGSSVKLLGLATTGYGEMLFASAFDADSHVVETVAHSLAAQRLVPDVSFILDIGGQDMKAIWVKKGVVSDIVVNEACSSGCGSFLEGFAASLGIPVSGIAEAAFRSEHPASLGSRCTVFMNSSIVSEQRNGKTPDDIMAGLCRSIIENVFTKVVRLSNFDALGPSIVVQGGTFCNDAVLRAFEQYVGRNVTRAPYAGLMGAFGAALVAKSQASGIPREGGLSALSSLSYTTETNAICPLCANHCSRMLVTFSNGATWVTGNRCDKGSVVGDIRDDDVRERVREIANAYKNVPNVFETRKQLLAADYPVAPVSENSDTTIGIPRVLSYWETLPFWSALFRALGFSVVLSDPSTRDRYESGLSGMVSDTICFPAKLVHGHIRNLEDKRVDRIFMPAITTVPSENASSTSISMCAVVKGYSLVIRNSDNPERRSEAKFDDPLFHWFTDADRVRQLCAYFKDEYGIPESTVKQAIRQGDAAQAQFRADLAEAGRHAIEFAKKQGGYAVVLASRPYHNDDLVNHGLPDMFVHQGIAVLPPDAVPGVNDVNLSRSRLDVVNNYHARMLSSALIAAQSYNLEYVQLVSFGCGHDAYLSDEIVRLMHAVSDKTPLVLKVDEGSATGPLKIRVRSFVETVKRRRSQGDDALQRSLPDPYPVKFRKEDLREKVILVPNTSHAFARLMSVAFAKQGVRAVPLEMGGEEAIRLGKKYVHNDICFPAQMTIGEALAALESGEYDSADVCVGTGKYIGDCRLTHYAALLRKALDDAGYGHVPIVTNDDVDSHNLHPGFRLSVSAALLVALALPMVDALEELLRKIRPYELETGAADRAFEQAMDELMDGLDKGGLRSAKKAFSRAIDCMCAVEYDRSNPRPTVLIVGEYLLNFHPGANRHIEAYLERNGMEIIEARMTDVIRKTYFYQRAQVREFGVDRPLSTKTWNAVADNMFEIAHNVTDKIAVRHPLYEPAMRMPQLVKASDPIMHHTFDAGEGVLIPGEILHHAKKGCKAFVILQPFGCLPNHVCGRGVSKRLKELCPDAQVLPLDYDPDVSFANIENRLQMLVMNAKLAAEDAAADAAADVAACAENVGAAVEEGAADR